MLVGCEGFHNDQCVLLPNLYPLVLLQTGRDLVAFYMGT